METKNREKLLFIAVGACVVLWLINLLVVSPLTASWHRRSAQIDSLHKSISDGQMLVRRQNLILARWNRMNTNSLSSTPTVAESQLFSAFDRWVHESGVTQGSFKPQLKETDDGYSTEECRADVTGNIQTIVRFLYDLEKDPMAVRLQGVELTSRDDTGQQLSLGLELSGLLMPPPDPLLVNIGDELGAISEETNATPGLDWATFQTIAQKNIFDPTRSGRVRIARARPSRAPVTRAFTFNGVTTDGVTNAVAMFSGEGVRGSGIFKVGNTLNGFKLRQIRLHQDPRDQSSPAVVTMTDPGGILVTLKMDESMRREDNGPWNKSDEPAPMAMTASEPPPIETSAAPTPGSDKLSEILRRLKLKREQAEK